MIKKEASKNVAFLEVTCLQRIEYMLQNSFTTHHLTAVFTCFVSYLNHK